MSRDLTWLERSKVRGPRPKSSDIMQRSRFGSDWNNLDEEGCGRTQRRRDAEERGEDLSMEGKKTLRKGNDKNDRGFGWRNREERTWLISSSETGGGEKKYWICAYMSIDGRIDGQTSRWKEMRKGNSTHASLFLTRYNYKSFRKCTQQLRKAKGKTTSRWRSKISNRKTS